MTRRERIAAVAGLLLILAAFPISLLQNLYVFRYRESVVRTANCAVPITSVEHTSDLPPGMTAVILHGLSANRKLMEPVARSMAVAHLRAYVLDMPGHGDSAEPFSFERAEQCAAEFLDALTAQDEIDPARTVLVGHSTGAAIAIRIAARFDAAATVAISPAPLSPQPGPWEQATPLTLPERLPANLLVFIASLDPFPIRDSAKQWIAAAGGNRDSDADFAARRALQLVDLPRNTHTSLLVDSHVARQSATWIQAALPLDRHQVFPPAPLFGYAIALLGVVLVFPAAATLSLGRIESAANADPRATPTAWKQYATWTAGSALAAPVLYVWIPLRPLRLFTGDYLASFLLIVALPGLFVFRSTGAEPAAGRDATLTPRSILGAALLGFAAMLAVSWLLAWHLTDVWMNAARWLRFPFVLLAVFPYALAEELAFGPPGSGASDGLRRLLRALGLRAVLWLAMLAAFLLLGSNQILLPLLMPYLALFSIAQRLAADAVRRRSRGATAAALFSAILAAWFVAAVFPLL